LSATGKSIVCPAQFFNDIAIALAHADIAIALAHADIAIALAGAVS